MLGMPFLGDRIKHLRKKMGVSQEALCARVCSQSEISRIENNKIIPSSYVVQKISEKLGVSIEYFYRDSIDQRNEYLNEVKRQLDRARRYRDYQEIQSILRYESNNLLLKQDKFMEKYFNWHNGIVLYHLHEDKNKALKTLMDSTNLFEDYLSSELDIEIHNSIGIILRNEQELERAATYLEKALRSINEFPFINKSRLFSKVSYNLSKVYTDIGLLEKSLSLCNNGIKHCKNNEDLFLFAEFHYQAGRNWLKVGNEKLGLSNWKKAIEILKLEGKQQFVDIIEQDINQFRTDKVLVQ